MASLNELENKIKKIEERNAKVEADKAWETSYARRTLIVVFTYLAIAVYLNAINIPEPWFNAIVPAIAFMLSTLTFPFFKKIWFEHFYKK